MGCHDTKYALRGEGCVGEQWVGELRRVHLGEEIIDQPEEDAKVGLDKLGQVDVTQGPHEDLHLRLVGLGALHAAGDAQDALPS